MIRPLQIALGIFSAIAILPAIIFLAGGMFFFIGGLLALFSLEIFLPDGSLDIDFVYLIVSYIAGVFAITKILLLCSATIRGQSVRFSKWLILAVVGGCLSGVSVWLIAGFHAFLFVVLPPLLLSGLLLRIQFELRKR